jgi:hypothetical protein
LEETEKRVLFGTWLASIRASERDSGVDHRELACYASKLTPYVQGHMSEALHDLEKLYTQLPPTVAEESDQREAWEGLREEYVRTLRQALDHLAATLTAVGCTDAELGGVLGTPEGEDPPGAGDETAEVPVPSWVAVNLTKASISPSDVAVVSGNGTKK